MTRRRLSLRASWAIVAALALVATACGPRNRVHVGLRGYATDVVYGSQKKPAPPKPQPAASLEPTFPTFIQPLQQPAMAPVQSTTDTSTGVRAPAPAGCVSAGFSVPARHAVTPGVPAPPKAAVYPIRQSGYVAMGGQSWSPAPEAARAVQNVVKNADSTFSFDVADAQPSGAVTVTTYMVDQRTGLPATDGISITQVVSRAPDGTVDQFAPTTPIRILSLPADASNPTWASAGTDGTHNLTMSIHGTIVGHGRVDACGTVLDSWQVQASGRILSPAKQLSFTSVYSVGTHFGGLVLADTLQLSGTDQGVAVAPTQGAQCQGGTSQATLSTVTTLAAQAPCPGFAVSRDTADVINVSPAVVK